MPSSVAWLDTSADEQRRVRDLIALFSEHESRDELGVGQIRDVLSDLLFPGTSVLQTRARYFLLVPWCFQHAARQLSRQSVRPGGPRSLVQQAYLNERQLVSTLSKTEAEGVIGRRAGSALKNLPSAVFWSGLRRYGILTRDVGPSQLTGRAPRHSLDEAEEIVGHALTEWSPTLPPVPPDFPWTLEGGLDLSYEEASWLRERMVESSRGSLLEHLLMAGDDPAPATTAAAPWEHATCLTAPASVRAALDLAHGFSLLMHGASLLYNLLVAERYEDSGLTRVDTPVQTYRDRYAEWRDRVADENRLLDRWDIEELWSVVDAGSSRVGARTRRFVNEWTRAARSAEAASTASAHSPSATVLGAFVAEREREIKRTQSRLTNAKLLGSWNGASGARAITFRWTQVARIVTDVRAGLAPENEAAVDA